MSALDDDDDDQADAVAHAHRWFEHHSGWAPPDSDTLEEWVSDGVCRCPDECLVAPRGICAHGLASWLTILEQLDVHSGTAAGAQPADAPPAAGPSGVTDNRGAP